MKVKKVDFKRFLDTEKRSKDALRLASKHDPDLLKMIKDIIKSHERLIDHVNKQLGVAGKLTIEERISVCERILARSNAPKYRKV